MKKVIYLLVLAVLCGSFLAVNFSQAVEENNVNRLIKEAPILKNIKNIKSGPLPSVIAKDKESQQDQNKLNTVQQRTNKIRLYFNNMVRKIQAAINRESKLADRIESKLNKFEAAGKDISALKTKLADARMAIKDAQKYLDDAKAQIENVLKADNVKQMFSDVKALIKNAVEKIKLAHQKLVDIINSMKGMSDKVCKKAADCGKPLVCKDGKEYPAWACNDGKCDQIKYFKDPCVPLPSVSASPSVKLETLTGNLTKNSESAPHLIKGYWYLVYEAPGAPALLIQLFFHDRTIYTLNVGDRVKVTGVKYNGGFLVETLDKLQ